MVRYPRGSYIAIPTVVSGAVTPENKVQLIGAVIHKQESRHKVPKSVIRAVLGRMQFVLHAIRRTPHGASHLVQATSALLVKSRRSPSRHSRDARVYGHTTAAMHELSSPLPWAKYIPGVQERRHIIPGTRIYWQKRHHT